MATSSESEILVGGQAVMEGVMMKMARSWAVTVRRGNGDLVSTSGVHVPWSDRWPVLRLPLLRGVATLGQMLSLGMNALFFSSDIQARDANAARGGPPSSGTRALMFLSLGNMALLQSISGGPEGDEPDTDAAPSALPSETPTSSPATEPEPTSPGFSKRELAVSITMAVVMFVLVFKALPLGVAWAGGQLWSPLKAPLAESLLSGLALGGIFVGYLALMSRVPDIRRVFQYHGAEHKVVHVAEARQPMTVESARPHPTVHPRCGTSFLFFVVLTSIVVWSLFPLHVGFLGKLLLRVALLPLVLGVAYELIRLSARHRTHPFFRALMAPGLWSQRITTKPPDDAMLEVSLRSYDLAAARSAS